MAQAIVGRGIMLISQLVLAKLLMPEDFGILGLATTVFTLFNLFITFGTDQVLQQRANHMRFWVTQVFWLSLSLSILAGLIMAGCAPFAARLYHNDKIIPLIWVLALSFPFQALVTVPQVHIQAQLRFKFLATYNTAESIALQLLTIALAWQGWEAMSFVIPTLALTVVRAGVFWWLAPQSLLPFHKAKGWLKICLKSASVFVGRASVNLISQGDYITLGLLAPAEVVGAYFFAFKLAVQPMTLLASNFTNVLMPTLVAMGKDTKKQRDATFKTAFFLGLLTTPLCLGLAVIAKPFLTVLFAERWNAAVPYIQILSLGLPLDALSWPAGALLIVRGDYFLKAVYLIISAVFFYVLVGIGGIIGSATGVAIAVAIYYVVHPLTFTSIVFTREGISLRKILSIFVIPYLLTFASLCPAYFLAKTAFLSTHLIFQMAVTLGTGGLIYCILTYYFQPAFFKEMLSRGRALIPASNR